MVAMPGTEHCHFVEPKANLHAMILCAADLPERGWLDAADKAQAFTVDRAALLHARQCILRILRTASADPQLFDLPEVAESLQEDLLLAIDGLFDVGSASDRSLSITGERSSSLVRRIDDYIASHPTSPIYTANLAGEFGVSMRTLGAAVTKVRGMSLHQYIRLKKLWATRTRLLKGGGGITVASCARSNGFHHMGEFAALYRAAFNESPSETLGRSRQAETRIAEE